jgi:hypothetical protein
MNPEKMMFWKGFEKWHYPVICPEGPKKTSKVLSQDIRWPEGGSNRITPDYELEVSRLYHPLLRHWFKLFAGA